MPRTGARIGAVMVAATLLSGSHRLIAAQIVEEGDAVPHRVRFDAPDIARAFRDATTRSATFRRLVQTIDRSDGVVYVERGSCGHGVRACLAMSVTQAGPDRVLRLVIDKTKQGDDVLVSFGHELQHAAEVLNESAITTGARMFHFYKSFGTWAGDTFETPEAVHVGEAVRRELAESRRVRR